MEAFAWYNLIFYIPLALGIVMALGVALGIADVPHGVDLDGDGVPDIGAGLDHDHDHDGHGGRAFALLGFGKVPVLLVFMTMALVFGAVGVICNLFLGSLLPATGGLLALGSAGAAFVSMVVLTGTFSKAVARLMPTLETNSTGKSDLVGCTGFLTMDCTLTNGLAQIYKGKDLHQIDCRSDVPIPKGQPILVTDYEVKGDYYTVCLSPTAVQ